MINTTERILLGTGLIIFILYIISFGVYTSIIVRDDPEKCSTSSYPECAECAECEHCTECEECADCADCAEAATVQTVSMFSTQICNSIYVDSFIYWGDELNGTYKNTDEEVWYNGNNYIRKSDGMWVITDTEKDDDDNFGIVYAFTVTGSDDSNPPANAFWKSIEFTENNEVEYVDNVILLTCVDSVDQEEDSLLNYFRTNSCASLENIVSDDSSNFFSCIYSEIDDSLSKVTGSSDYIATTSELTGIMDDDISTIRNVLTNNVNWSTEYSVVDSSNYHSAHSVVEKLILFWLYHVSSVLDTFSMQVSLSTGSSNPYVVFNDLTIFENIENDSINVNVSYKWSDVFGIIAKHIILYSNNI